MRMTINDSVPAEMHAYILNECGYLTVSGYNRSLVHRDRLRREDYAARPGVIPVQAKDCMVFAEALDQLDRLKAILERRGPGDD
jgi:hypothetical protein